MAVDQIGAISLPESPTDSPMGDPARQYVGDYLKAYLRSRLDAAFASAKLGAGRHVVEAVEVNDPKDNTFTTNALPCLYLFRDRRGAPERRADDVWVRVAPICILWVPEPAVQDVRADMDPFFAAVEGCVYTAIAAGRDPSWVAAGDTDPEATRLGSLLVNYVKSIELLTIQDSELIPIEIPMSDGTDRKTYPALKFKLKVVERITLNTNRWTTPPALDESTSSNGASWGAVKRNVV